MKLSIRRTAAFGLAAAAVTAASVVGIAGNTGAETTPTAFGQLKITKVVVGTTTNRLFDIQYDCGSGVFGAFQLGHNGLNGLNVPAGSICTVTETPVEGFSTSISPNPITIIADQINLVTVTNTFTPPPPPPPSWSPRTRGYWSNHCENMNLALSLGGFSVPNCTVVASVFGAGNGRFMEHQLAAQLLAAKANVAEGSNNCIAGTIAAADALLSGLPYTGPGSQLISSQSPLRADATSLKDALDRYNNGLGC